MTYIAWTKINSKVFGLNICSIPILQTNKPRPAQVGAISKAQKQQKDFIMSKYWWVGDPFMEKIFLKKVSQCQKKLKGRTLWGFSKSILSQNIKKMRADFNFRKQISHCRKKTEMGTLWDFPTTILSQNSKKIEGGPFGENFFPEKITQCRKKTERGTLWSRPVWYVTRENRKNLFGSVRFWCKPLWCNLVQ